MDKEGGVWGHAEFLEAIANSKHEEHERILEWAGDFDPEEFDASETTKTMRQGLPDWRQM
ncbi:plasmid pRiA4b ORF-3 family protein [Rubripirellula reticaptiva]|uniref:plasmid pRiA4b ORF-3 family protein n=1 Tax=Rubripirellula reticaptiva TaxID=2528013 RepID=UPI0011B4A534